jgi:hypothetical protein
MKQINKNSKLFKYIFKESLDMEFDVDWGVLIRKAKTMYRIYHNMYKERILPDGEYKRLIKEELRNENYKSRKNL